jgi:hypothetical protein
MAISESAQRWVAIQKIAKKKCRVYNLKVPKGYGASHVPHVKLIGS